MLLNCDDGEDSWESVGLQGDPTSPFWRKSVLGVRWKDWCWGWNSNTLATSCIRVDSLEKTLMLGGIGGRRRRGRQRVRWLDGITNSMHEFGWTPGVGDGQGGLACWDSRGRKESDMTERLNWSVQLFQHHLLETIFAYSCLLCWRLLDYRCTGFISEFSILFHWYMYCFCANTRLFWLP